MAETAISLFYAGACVRVVDEDPIQGDRRTAASERSLPGADGDLFGAVSDFGVTGFHALAHQYSVNEVVAHRCPALSAQVPGTSTLA